MEYNRPRLRRRLTAFFTLLLSVGLMAMPATASASNHTIRICHATASESNPYNALTVPKHQVADPKGHGSFESGVHPGDIIPPFAAGSQGNNSWAAYPGKNWDATGQAIWDAGCRLPGDDGFVPAPSFELGVDPDEVCLGDEVSVTGENTGNVELHITGVLKLPNSTEMPLNYVLAAGQTFTVDDTPVQLGEHEIVLDYAYDGEKVGTESVSFTVVDCDPPVVTQCPAGFTQISPEGVSPILCTRTVTDVQERIVERQVVVEVPVPGLPDELPTGPGPDDTTDTETPELILPTELATGFGPEQGGNPLAWYLIALIGLAVPSAAVALRRT